MNYLAHLYLAGNDPELVVGGFLGDFVKGRLNGNYPENIELGMQLHRRIDSWSDQHQLIASMRQLLPSELGKYTGIICDLMIDHFLSIHWQRFSNRPIELFAEKKMAELSSAKSLFPEKALWVFTHMEKGSWLTNYHKLDYCLGALYRIGTRLKRGNPFGDLDKPLNQNYQQLEEICVQIFNDVHTNVAEWRAENDRLKLTGESDVIHATT